MANPAESPETRPVRGFARLVRLFRPSHQHTAFSATLLLMTAVMLSRVIGYVREAYIAYAFGAGPATDAYVAGFTIPDWLNYLVAGGTASITFVSIYTRFLAANREDEAQKTFSIIITVMTAVLGVGVLLAEFFAPEISRHLFPDFSAEQLELCVHLTRILLPAQIFFYVGGVVSAVLLSRRLFLFPAFSPLLYNAAIILGGVLLSHRFGIASLAYGALAGSFLGPFLINAIGAARIGTGYSISFDVRNPAFREWVRLSIPLMLGVSLVTADDWILRYFASGAVGDITRLNYAKRLFAVPIAVLGQATSQASLPFFAKLFGEKRMREFADTVNGSIYRVVATSLLATSFMMAAALPLIDLVYRRGHFRFSDSQETALVFLLVRAFPVLLVGAGALLAGVLCRREHARPHGREQPDHGGVNPFLLHAVSQVFNRGAGHGVRSGDRGEYARAGTAAPSAATDSHERIALGGDWEGWSHIGGGGSAELSGGSRPAGQ